MGPMAAKSLVQQVAEDRARQQGGGGAGGALLLGATDLIGGGGASAASEGGGLGAPVAPGAVRFARQVTGVSAASSTGAGAGLGFVEEVLATVAASRFTAASAAASLRRAAAAAVARVLSDEGCPVLVLVPSRDAELSVADQMRAFASPIVRSGGAQPPRM